MRTDLRRGERGRQASSQAGRNTLAEEAGAGDQARNRKEGYAMKLTIEVPNWVGEEEIDDRLAGSWRPRDFGGFR